MMKRAKQITYYYDTALAGDETELDLDGDIPVPAKGGMREHGGKTWRVEFVRKLSSPNGMFTNYSVYLKEVGD